MHEYLKMLQTVVDEGSAHGDRTGTGTSRIFGYQAHFDISSRFPLVTTKKMSFRNIALELLWFMRGHTDERLLSDSGVNIWAEWGTLLF